MTDYFENSQNNENKRAIDQKRKELGLYRAKENTQTFVNIEPTQQAAVPPPPPPPPPPPIFGNSAPEFDRTSYEVARDKLRKQMEINQSQMNFEECIKLRDKMKVFNFSFIFLMVNIIYLFYMLFVCFFSFKRFADFYFILFFLQ
jgi:excinuclease UvrABC helicase subunit UvrB